MKRREFLIATAAASSAVLTPSWARAVETRPLWSKLPRWRGFNLLELFYRNEPFRESDFQWISEWGFDFVRLPMDYLRWTDRENPEKLNEQVLANVDTAVEFGRKYGVHVCMNLHNAPGFTVNHSVKHTLNLWKDAEAQRQFAFQWGMLAKRYRDVDSTRLSFNLVNEPANIDAASYLVAVRPAIDAIRAVSPDRVIITDGVKWGTQPVDGAVELHLAHMTRGYQPFELTHYKASWVRGERFALPKYPTAEKGRDWLKRTCIDPWVKAREAGSGVMVGEWGAYKYTPHDVVLRWAEDLLELWAEAGFGWAMWNLRGTFGIVDSGREDCVYEDFHGHKLDRRLFELLKAH